MGAMIVGMATGFFALLLSLIWKIMLLSIIFIDSRRHKMNSLRWILAALLLDLLLLPFYIYAKVRLLKDKCPDCSCRIEKDSSFCKECGRAVDPFDESTFAKKVLTASVIFYVFSILFSIFHTIISSV